MDTNKINELAKILRQNQLTKLDLTEGDCRIVLETAGGRSVEVPVVPVENKPEILVETASVVEKTEPVVGVEQKSPLVGTVYLAPQVGAEPFVKVGDQVKNGQTVCILEAMKLMNEIQAEYDCEIEAVLVINEQKVEYGQPLFRVKKL